MFVQSLSRAVTSISAHRLSSARAYQNGLLSCRQHLQKNSGSRDLFNGSSQPTVSSTNRTAKWLFRAGGVVLFGATAATLASAADDLLLYYSNERKAMEAITEHPLLIDVLGKPIKPRPWWNASVTKSPNGQTVQVYFVVDGSKASSDIYMRAMRYDNSVHTLLYNTFGSANWEVLFLDAMLPDKVAGARLPVRVDLLGKKEGMPQKPVVDAKQQEKFVPPTA